MLYKSKRKRLYKGALIGSALCIAGLTMFSCSDTYDLDTEQPSGLNTIYGYMKDQGNFENVLHLIDDLGYTEVLSKTGSKTLFAANDDAFNEFYKSNEWGVKSYNQLSLAQKKLLLNSAMIDNPYPTSMLSTAEGPVKGEVCRRSSSMSIYDSVQVISTTSPELPQNPTWFNLRSSHSEIVLFKDNSASNPMIHFTPKFLTSEQIESSDIDFLYNDPAGTRQSDDTYVNKAKIVETENCKNGFIHVVDRVIVPLDNMAEVIRKESNMSTYSSILERFAAPSYSQQLTLAYNQNKGTNVDSVYIKKYFSDRSAGSGYDMQNRETYDAAAYNQIFGTDYSFAGSLKYDPGWNAFIPEIFNNRTPMMEDMAVMLVPNNDAMVEWWNNGGGKVIKDAYGTIENTPTSVLAELINVNMLNSLIASVPSRFKTILNDANEPMGVTRETIDKVHLGCNGVIYETNKVYAPASYSSVLFPAVIDTENLNIIKNAIDNLDYKAYLNSMVSTNSFFIPTNNGLLTYVDPVSYGKTTTEMWEFHFDETKTSAQQIYADVYACVKDENGHWTKTGDRLRQITGGTGNAQIKNRMEDILDNIIGVEEVYEGKKYVITKGKNFIEIGGTANVAGSMTASGTWQTENGEPCVVQEIYNMENGRAYIVDGVLSGTRYSVADLLAGNEDLREFYKMMVSCGLLGISTSDGYCSSSQHQDTQENQDLGIVTRGNLVTTSGTGSNRKTYSLFNQFHYTVYAPTNEAMKKAYAAGLPDLDSLARAEAYDSAHEDDGAQHAEEVMAVMRDFVRYHIQNNSIYLDNGFATGNYESLKNKMEVAEKNGSQQNPETGAYYCISGSPYRINVTSVSPTAMTVRDAMGNTRNIITSGGLFNMQAREYWLKGTNVNSANSLENSSTVVVHAIDGPLLYDAEQFIYVPREIISDDF